MKPEEYETYFLLATYWKKNGMKGSDTHEWTFINKPDAVRVANYLRKRGFLVHTRSYKITSAPLHYVGLTRGDKQEKD